jgi:hypothetical protein
MVAHDSQAARTDPPSDVAKAFVKNVGAYSNGRQTQQDTLQCANIPRMKKAPILSELSLLWLANSIAVFLDDRFLSIAVAILFLDDRLAFGLTLFDDRRPIAVMGLAYCHASTHGPGRGAVVRWRRGSATRPLVKLTDDEGVIIPLSEY